MVGRPVLKPGLRRLWRDASTLQVGLDPRRAVVVEDVDSAASAFLDRLDGTVPNGRLDELAAEVGLDPRAARSLVRRLTTHGVLDDAAADTSARRSLSRAERDRLAPDLAAWALASDEPGHAGRTHAGRRRARVDVHGAGRVGALAAALLTHAGVGTLHVDDQDPLRAGDVPAPWARAAPPDSSAPPPRSAVVLDVCEQLAPSLRTARRSGRPQRAAPRRPTVALVAPVDSAGTVALELRDALLRDGVPHLPAYVRETVGVVGPFVVPGRTPCLRCVDLSRSERDPAWPHLLAQLCPPPRTAARPARASAEASDGVLATAVSALAATQVLAFLDGCEPAALATSIEIELGDGLTRRKTWVAHPACGCRWR